MSALGSTVRAMHHPWRRLRELADWTLRWARLPHGLLGHTDYDTRTVTLDDRLTQAERRCTIDHEVEHIHRGPAVMDHLWPREERTIDRIVAQRLLPDVTLIADALAWADWDLDLAADELWVDRATLACRLETMTHPAERVYMRNRFEETT